MENASADTLKIATGSPVILFGCGMVGSHALLDKVTLDIFRCACVCYILGVFVGRTFAFRKTVGPASDIRVDFYTLIVRRGGTLKLVRHASTLTRGFGCHNNNTSIVACIYVFTNRSCLDYKVVPPKKQK